MIFAQCQVRDENVFYISQTTRQGDCRKAIDKMVEALKKEPKGKK